MVQQLAEKYVGELAEMAKQSKLVIVPDRPSDVSGVLATAMGVYGQAEAHMSAAGARRPEVAGTRSLTRRHREISLSLSLSGECTRATAQALPF